MKNQKKMLVILISLVAAVALIIAGTLAYFTDYAQGTSNTKTGTVDIGLSMDENALLNTGGINNFNPGDARNINFTVTNYGTKSVDLRTTFLVSVFNADGTPFNLKPIVGENGGMGFAVYSAQDVEGYSLTNGYEIQAGKVPIASDFRTNHQMRVVVTGEMLDGQGDDGEHDSGETDRVFSLDGKYVLVMLNGSDNRLQNKTVQLDILVEAKQHRNTQSVAWTSLQTKTIIFGNNNSVLAVPGANDKFNGDPIN